MCRDTDDRLRSVPDVEPVLTATASANLLELSTVTKKQIAALAGVTPRNRDSGTLHGTRMVGPGARRSRRPSTWLSS